MRLINFIKNLFFKKRDAAGYRYELFRVSNGDMDIKATVTFAGGVTVQRVHETLNDFNRIVMLEVLKK